MPAMWEAASSASSSGTVMGVSDCVETVASASSIVSRRLEIDEEVRDNAAE
jgi:hypothetical protein